jgi:hypothetical protein
MIWVGKQNTRKCNGLDNWNMPKYLLLLLSVVLIDDFHTRLPEALKCDFCALHNGTAEDQAALGIFTHPNISLISESVFESIFQG